jgi:phosphoserine phosphatase RsbU/P
VGSALLSVSVLNVLRSQSLPGVDFAAPEQVLKGLNEAFQMQDHNNLYFTIWYGVYNRPSRRLHYANGGHPPSILFAKDGAAVELMASNFVIGAFPRVSYCSKSIEVELPADLYIFSDGVYEVENAEGTMWSLQELGSYLSETRGAKEEIDRLYRSLQQMCGREVLDDDFSMVKVSLSG